MSTLRHILLLLPTVAATPITGADSLTPSLTESSAIQPGVSGSESLTPSLTETSGLLSALGRSDTLTPSLTESAGLVVLVGRTDTLTPSVTDSSAVAALQTGSDTLTPSVGDASSLLSVVGRSDTLTPSVTDSSTLLSVVGRTDSLTPSVTDTSSPQVQTAVADTLTPSVGDSATLVVGVNRADTLTPSLTDVAGLKLLWSVTETLTPSVTESGSTSLAVPLTMYLAVGRGSGITVYPWDVSGFGTAFPDGDDFSRVELARDVTFAPDGTVLATAHGGSPYETAWAWSPSGFGARYSDASTSYIDIPGPRGVVFSPSQSAIIFANGGDFAADRLRAWAWSSSGFGAQYTNPDISALGNLNAVAFSPDGTAVALAHDSAPYLTVFAWDDVTGFGDAYGAPADAIPDSVNCVEFSSDGAMIFVGHYADPGLTAYDWNPTTGFGSQYQPSAGELPGGCFKLAVTPGGRRLAVALGSDGTTPSFGGINFTEFGFGSFGPPSAPPEGFATDVAISPDGQYVACSHDTEPYVSVWSWSQEDGFLTKYSAPTDLPPTPGWSIAFGQGEALTATPISATDTLTPSVSESSFIQPGVSGTDTLTPSVTESRSVVVTLSRVDVLTPALTEATELLAVLSCSDVLTPALAEVVGIFGTLSVADTLTPSLTEGASVALMLAAADTLTPSLTEASSRALVIAVADTLTPALAEAAQSAAVVVASDVLTPGLDATVLFACTVSAADTLTPSLTDAAWPDVPGMGLRALVVRLKTVDGAPVVGAVVSALRVRPGGGLRTVISTRAVQAVTDAAGVAVLSLLPSFGDAYRIVAVAADGRALLNVAVLMPPADADLDDLPPVEGLTWH